MPVPWISGRESFEVVRLMITDDQKEIFEKSNSSLSLFLAVAESGFNIEIESFAGSRFPHFWKAKISIYVDSKDSDLDPNSVFPEQIFGHLSSFGIPFGFQGIEEDCYQLTFADNSVYFISLRGDGLLVFSDEWRFLGSYTGGMGICLSREGIDPDGPELHDRSVLVRKCFHSMKSFFADLWQSELESVPANESGLKP